MKKKVLIVITTQLVEYGGLSTVMLNYFRALNNPKIVFDFVSTNDCSSDLKREIENRGGKYYKIGNRKSSPIKYVFSFYKLLKSNNYDIVHVNGNSATMIFELLPAAILKVKRRIAHVHSMASDYGLLSKILQPLFLKSYTDAISVSEESGKWLFTKGDYTILNNAINLNKYSFNEDIRIKLREKYKLNGKTVLGCVGKLTKNKNHEFVIDLLNQLITTNNNFKLILVGDGPERLALEKKVQDLCLQDNVVFVGMTDCAAEYYNAMDILLFPSHKEGFGLVALEAQANGLLCLCSQNVPSLTKQTPNIEYYSLENEEDWINKMLEYKSYDRIRMSLQAIADIQRHGFDICTEAKKLEKFYEIKR